jgi:hypothetical protein
MNPTIKAATITGAATLLAAVLTVVFVRAMSAPSPTVAVTAPPLPTAVVAKTTEAALPTAIAASAAGPVQSIRGGSVQPSSKVSAPQPGSTNIIQNQNQSVTVNSR